MMTTMRGGPPMPSNSSRAFRACFRKEWLCEFRSKQGIFLSALFGFMSMAAVSFSTSNQTPSPMLAGGLFTLITLFTAMTAVPRLYIAEEEQGTFDLVRQWGNCGATWLGKATFAILHQGSTGLILGIIFTGIINLPVSNWPIYLLSTTLLSIAAANVLSLTSSLVITANNRWVLATVVALPLLFPLLFLGIGSIRVAFGEGSIEKAFQSIAAIVAYAVIPLGIGPSMAESLWRERRDPSQPANPKQNKGGK
ncbi:MAG: heme exporter protein CcmB [Fimbriimonadaceae bacterium]